MALRMYFKRRGKQDDRRRRAHILANQEDLAGPRFQPEAYVRFIMVTLLWIDVSTRIK